MQISNTCMAKLKSMMDNTVTTTINTHFQFFPEFLTKHFCILRNTFFYQMIKVLMITDISTYFLFLPMLFYAFEKKIVQEGKSPSYYI